MEKKIFTNSSAPLLPSENLKGSNQTNLKIKLNFNPKPVLSCDLKPFGKGLSDNQIKETLIKYSKKKMVKTSVNISELEILNVEYEFANVYELMTYNEERKFKEKYKPYKQGRIDDETLGKRPTLWEIKSSSPNPELWAETKEKVIVPHSESIKTCTACKGSGTELHTVTTTDAEGNTTTTYIQGPCSRCLGNGNLVFYLVCKIKFKTTSEVFLSNRSGLSIKKLKKAKGKCIFENSGETVLPVDYLSDPEITEASQNMIREMECKVGGQIKTIHQKQTLTIIPIAKCHYEHKNKAKHFYVYSGEDNEPDGMKAFASDFPLNDIGCSIL